MAERYGLLAMIAFGQGVIGTVASLPAVVEAQAWTTDAVLVAMVAVAGPLLAASGVSMAVCLLVVMLVPVHRDWPRDTRAPARR